ncbi:hypothetical protein C3B51_17845 [Pseudoalteromonas rubra]|uniref:Uncharacterized protein n=1 Tax=Pseudoalteromonas rubra TaxID=43658 RepID=A0A4Q7E4C4_9GAMM|nr:DUF5455 family protein [Pseudoalteromonas rubra]RZM76428.1 hypothetical protein C3B51_17845 [Pseudoalteromonas rubra]
MPAFLLPIITGAASMMRFPALIAFFAGLFGQVIAFFAKYLTTKVAMQLTIVTAVSGLTLAVFAAIKALILAISVVAPEGLIHGASLVIPDNAAVCLSSIVSAHAVRYVWVWKVYFIESFAQGR